MQREKGSFHITYFYVKWRTGTGIQKSNTKHPILDVIHKFNYNNFDASVLFDVNCKTIVNFHLKKPDEYEIWEEIKLQSEDFFKLLKHECTNAKKTKFPPRVDIDKMKEEVLTLIRNEINALW